MTRTARHQQEINKANASLRRQHAAAAQITVEIKDGIIVRPTACEGTVEYERQSNRFCHGILATLVDNDITRRDLDGLMESPGAGLRYPEMGGAWCAALQFARNHCDIFEFLARLDPNIADLDETPWYWLHQGALRGLPLSLVTVSFGDGGHYTPTIDTHMGRVASEKINVNLLRTALMTMGKLKLKAQTQGIAGRLEYLEYVSEILLSAARYPTDGNARARFEGYEAHLRERAEVAAYLASQGE